MVGTEVSSELVEGGVRRRRRSAEERRLIVEETLEAGSSVARVARKYGINANQVFQWRRLYRQGHLGGASKGGLKLVPVTVAEDVISEHAGRDDVKLVAAIHIELPAGVRISVEGRVDPALVRAVLESLRP